MKLSRYSKKEMKKKMGRKCEECGCDEKYHELYTFMDGTKERIGCLICGENRCKKFKPSPLTDRERKNEI